MQDKKEKGRMWAVFKKYFLILGVSNLSRQEKWFILLDV